MAASSQNEQPKEAIPLLLLWELEEDTVEGITRFQKLVFLAQKGGLDDDPVPDDGLAEGPFDFESYDYGPFSEELYDTLDELRAKGLVEKSTRTTAGGNSRQDYRLTEEGKERVESQIDGALDEESRRVLKGIKMLYNDAPIFRLIDDVYEDYPEYAEDSELN